VARANLELDRFASAVPPELQLAFDLRDRARAFQSGAEAFEQAMQEAAAAVDTMQQAIKAREQRLTEVYEEYQRYLRQSEQA
jgi:exonuclease VII small subunit